MIKERGNQVIVKSQFNIGGSRGKSVKPFITDYVTRESAIDTSMAYSSPTGYLEPGDGVAFTLDASAVSRAETLRVADVVEEYFLEGNRAIQQMVISFSPEYLIEQGLVDDDILIENKGDYRYQYDDVRLRHAIRQGVQSMVDMEGYRDPQMIAAIQHDTLHLHAHVVVYENYPEIARKRGKEEKGVIKPSSFNQLTYDIDRVLTNTRTAVIPNEKKLTPQKESARVDTIGDIPKYKLDLWFTRLNMLLEEQLYEENRQRELELMDDTENEELVEDKPDGESKEIDLDKFLEDFYNRDLEQ